MTTTATANPAHLKSTDLDDIQGNLAGFNKDLQRLLFISFPAADAARLFLSRMATEEVNTAREVRDFNVTYKKRQQRGEDQQTVRASWVNVVVSFAGMQVLAPDGIAAFPDDFKGGMRARAAQIGDIGASDPSAWVGPFAAGAAAVHAMVIVAADSIGELGTATTGALLEARCARVQAIISATGVQECGSAQDGSVRVTQRGREHFGFKDGVSQPRVTGLIDSSKAGDRLTAPGEFLLGWPKEDGTQSGDALPPVVSSPTDPGYPNQQPSPQPQNLPAWTKNGSFAVYRRLRQNVAAFHSFASQQAPGLSLSAPQLEAKMVGRWPSGAPLERVSPEPAHFDATQADPGDPASPQDRQHLEVLEDSHVNNFGYAQHDADGHAVALAAHIRKMNPRDEVLPAGQSEPAHRILRRGLPYGSDLQPQEPTTYNSATVDDGTDRGLLFVCYQSSITNGFEFVQASWANNNNFPQDSAGQDPIITQNTGNPAFPLPPAHPELTTQQWVVTTGGEYFFSPSMAALRLLSGAS